MRTPPPDLSDAAVAAELRAGWGVDAARIDYLPVGFGSHHWQVGSRTGDWFVTADDLSAKAVGTGEPRDRAFERLHASLLTARALRDAGLQFVVAPIPGLNGAVVRRIDDRFALAVYPLLRGRSGAWGQDESRAQRLAVLERLVAIHGAPIGARAAAGVDPLVIVNRDELERAIGDLGTAWVSGPFAEPARGLLVRHAAGVEHLLAQYDQLARPIRAQPERFVLTHGEPHPGNTILTDEGWLLVDWDTALLAPPERDLWILAEGDPSMADAYEAATGRTVLPEALECYRLAWDLTDIAIFTTDFRQPHAATADTEKAFESLSDRLDLARRRPAFA